MHWPACKRRYSNVYYTYLSYLDFGDFKNQEGIFDRDIWKEYPLPILLEDLRSMIRGEALAENGLEPSDDLIWPLVIVFYWVLENWETTVELSYSHEKTCNQRHVSFIMPSSELILRSFGSRKYLEGKIPYNDAWNKHWHGRYIGNSSIRTVRRWSYMIDRAGSTLPHSCLVYRVWPFILFACFSRWFSSFK